MSISLVCIERIAACFTGHFFKLTMILQPVNVQLTKVHYYDKFKGIKTVSREVFENEFNRNVVIKSNIFGHKWVLKVNEQESCKKKSRLKLVVYVLVCCCIIIAVSFGVFLSIGKYPHQFYLQFVKLSLFSERRFINPNKTLQKTTIKNYQTTVKPAKTIQNITLPKLYLPSRSFCKNCTNEEVCLKIEESHKPKCHRILNKKDPTGCGGVCKINVQFCQLLDNKSKVYQCSNLKNTLKCSGDSFNCGNRCIKTVKKCDGIFHCSNKSDEENCGKTFSINTQMVVLQIIL